MKRYLGIFVAFAALVAAVILTYNKYDGLRLQAERELDRTRLQRDYLERVGFVRTNPDNKTYLVEANALFRWYVGQAENHAARFADSKDFGKDFNEYLSELEKRPDSNDGNTADRRARYDFVRDVFGQMRSGKYSPVWTGTDKGMRLDVLNSSVQTVEGQPKIRLDLVLWGASREMKEQGQNLKRMVASADFEGKIKLLDAHGKSRYEMEISGDPSLKTEYPERYVWAFPPQMVLGRYDVPLFPTDVSKAEITFHVTSRTPFGGVAEASYAWNLNVPAEWKGGQWKDAEVAVRPAEEIDPSKKPRSTRTAANQP